MHPNFGVGLRSYLFEQNTPLTFDDIKRDIQNQCARYLPYIGIDRIQFYTSEVSSNMDPNFMGITVFFTILPLQVSTMLQISANES